MPCARVPGTLRRPVAGVPLTRPARCPGLSGGIEGLQLHEVTGDHDGATTVWSQAHAIFERLNTPEADETSSSTDLQRLALSGDSVAERATDLDVLQRFVEAYNPKYG